MLSIIVAKAKNNIIGKNNQLIWRLPAESKKFKELTDGKIVIMGRKTYETLGKFLSEFSIIFTKSWSMFSKFTPNLFAVRYVGLFHADSSSCISFLKGNDFSIWHIKGCSWLKTCTTKPFLARI